MEVCLQQQNFAMSNASLLSNNGTSLIPSFYRSGPSPEEVAPSPDVLSPVPEEEAGEWTISECN